VKTTVENFFLPQTPDVTFYRNEADALAEENMITDLSNYRNIGYPNRQEIYIRVDSQISNDCQAFGSYITLIVEPLPIANPVSIERQCDSDTSDMLVTFPFDTSQIENDLLDGQNPADVTITYVDATGNTLSSPLPNPFVTESQIITIRVTNNSTSDPNGACFDETGLEFIVDKQPVANPVPPLIVCDGESGDIDDDGLYAFNTASIKSSILGSQTGMEVFFTFVNELGSLVTSQTLPNPLNSRNQTISVEVINPLNTICTAVSSIDLIVNPLPDFTIDTSQTVCSLDPSVTIILDPEEANTTESYDYSWVFNGTEIATTETLTVSTAGTYTVTLTKTDGTRCSRSREVTVNASEIATITQDDIRIVDLSENNTITIIDPTSLGAGDYWFSLQSTNGQIIYPYQDHPNFENVDAGFYTLFIEDKNGCGFSSLPISVIGYPRFFTPNNDGYNDVWQIQGINDMVQPDSDIYIFDRYGKLLKQLNPGSVGWDGTFNDNLMPSSDYWFKVLLQDGRTFSGHFSLKR
jgi:gliding motility-associated-like protein